jgi:3',5'-cyclic AMP phosphodiesterase CpdA
LKDNKERNEISRRDFIKTVSCAGIGFVLFSTGCAGKSMFSFYSSPHKDFFFIQMADPQLGFFNANKDFEKETVLFEKAIVNANRLRPEFVVICGDLINLPGDEKQLSELIRISAGLNPAIKLYWVAGNHDVKNAPTPESLAWYRKNLGPDWYSFKTHGVHFIVLNSCLFQHPEKAVKEAEKQMEWLKNDLDAASGDQFNRIIIFMHHPLFIKNRDEPDSYFPLPQKIRYELLNLFHEYGVSAVFSGHYHRNSYVKDGDMEIITNAPVGKPLGKDPSGFRIVKNYENFIVHSYNGFESMPESVLMAE